MSVVNQQTGEPVNDDGAAVVTAAGQRGDVDVTHAVEDSTQAADGSVAAVGGVQSYERLKKSRGGYLAHLTRLFNDAERLMADFKNHEHVAALGSSIDEQFEKFRAAHVACVAASADETETSVIVEGYNSQAANYNEFKQRVTDWERGRRDVANLYQPPAVNTDDIDRVSISSSAMTPNARARAAAVKRRLTELKLKQSRAEQELQRTEEQLEARRREVERQRQILQQESELEQAREEERLLSQQAQSEVNQVLI